MGDEFNVYEEDVEELLGNAGWMRDYREGVNHVLSAWGWDVQTRKPISPQEPGMGWTDWDVRLSKIIRSLWLFKQADLMESVQAFARHVKPKGGLRYGHINLDEVYSMRLEA